MLSRVLALLVAEMNSPQLNRAAKRIREQGETEAEREFFDNAANAISAMAADARLARR